MPKRWIPILAVISFTVVFQPQTAQAAYIDPATTSYIIQVVSGLVITLSVAIGVFFRKIQLFFVTLSARLSAFWIRLRTKQKVQHAPSTETRSALRRKPVTTRSKKGNTTDDLSVSKRAFLWSDQRSWKARLGLSFLSAFSLIMVFPFYTVLDLYAGNLGQFPFSIADLAPSLTLISLVGGVVLTLLLFILHGRVMDVAVSFVIGLAIASWAQINFMNPEFGQIMGQSIAWHEMTKTIFINLMVWILILGSVITVRVLSKKLWSWFVTLMAVLILAGSTISLLVTYSSSHTPSQESTTANATAGYYSWDNAFSLSSSHNVIVFLVDTLDATNINDILTEDPSFFEPLTGFTYYAQNMSRYSQTDPGVPSMLTGQDYLYKTTYDEYKTDAWKHADGLRKLKSAGYSLNVFSTKFNTYAYDSDLVGLVDNFATADVKINKASMVTDMLQLAAFISAPVVAKAGLWTTSTSFDPTFVSDTGAPQPFVISDADFHTKLDEEGLSIRSDQPQFNFIHFNGSHAAFTLNAQGYPAGHDTDVTTQTKGVFQIIFDYLDKMKQLDIYANSSVIIAGDHGAHVGAQTRTLDHPILAGLMVKNRESTESDPTHPSDAPWVSSNAPVSQDNFIPTILSDAGIIEESGISYQEVPLDSTTPRTYIWYRPEWEGDPSFGIRYEVVGDARKWENWMLIEKFPLLVD